jgi:predicted CopG family antitoxin
MSWKITNSKISAKPDAIKCIIDDIANSEKIKEICERKDISTGHASEIHRLVSDVIIKIFKEKRMRPSDVLLKYSKLADEETVKELIIEIVKMADSLGEIKYNVGNSSVEEEFSKLEASL